MRLIYALLLLASFACFVIAAIKYRRDYKGKQLLAAGLACWVAVPLLQTLQTLD